MEMSDLEYVLSIAKQESTSSLKNLWMIEKLDTVAMVYLPELIKSKWLFICVILISAL